MPSTKQVLSFSLLLLAAGSAIATLVSFGLAYPLAGYGFLAAGVILVVVLLFPIAKTSSQNMRRVMIVINKLAKAFGDDENYEAVVVWMQEVKDARTEREDDRSISELTIEVMDMCRAIDGEIAKWFVGDYSPSPKVLTISALQRLLIMISELFHKFTDRRVDVMILGRDDDEGKLHRLVTSPNESPMRASSQPPTTVLPGTDPGKVLDDGEKIIRSDVSSETLAIDKVWQNRSDFVKSYIAWPILIDNEVEACLKIDADKAETFRDTKATRFLAELCSRKVTAVYEFGRCLERAIEWSNAKEPDEAGEPRDNQSSSRAS